MWEKFTNFTKNKKLIFWGSLLGTLVIIVLVAITIFVINQNRLSNLAKFFGDWQTVSGKITQFDILMPGNPEYASQDLPLAGFDQKMRQEIYVSGDTHMSYFVSATLYPTKVTGGKEQNLRESLGGMLKAIPDGKIISSSYRVPFSGANYLEFEIYGDSSSTFYKGRLFLDTQSLYEAYVSYPKDSYYDPAYTHFVNSFHINY